MVPSSVRQSSAVRCTPCSKLSQITAAVAIRILNGEKAGDIKTATHRVRSAHIRLATNAALGNCESNLPPGSTIYFREPTVWERYSWQIALIIAVLLVQAGLISVLLREHRRRQFAEVQSRQRMAELAHVNRFSTAGELTASIAHEINQPLGVYSDQRRNRRGNPEISDALTSLNSRIS